LDSLTVWRRLWGRKLMVLLAILVAVAAALSTRYSVGSSGLVKKETVVSSSTTQLLVDTRYSSLAVLSLPTTADTLTTRTPLFADYAASRPVVDSIAAHARIAPDTLSVTAETTETAAPQGAAASTAYNNAPGGSAVPNQVTLSASDLLPVITISAQARSASKAAKLVQATIVGLQDAVHHLEISEHVKGPERMVLRSLGKPSGVSVTTAPKLTKSVILGVVVLLVLIVLILALDNIIRGRRMARRAQAVA
jgi:hypothetical protein